ncbi:MAG: hypothetical protein JEZ04_15875 [Spirochaetales bacterium]|nr:hypothetical protein [Spirochaetales bacterium]
MSQKFFCDNCGWQVNKDESICPHCGRYFKSVKCPACGFAGRASLFFDGCPACGYAGEGGVDLDFAEEARRKKPKGLFSGKFYRTAIPVLTALFIFLLIWFFRILDR